MTTQLNNYPMLKIHERMIEEIHTTLMMHRRTEATLFGIATMLLMFSVAAYVKSGSWILTAVFAIIAFGVAFIARHAFKFRSHREAILLGSTEFLSDSRSELDPKSGSFVEELNKHFKSYMMRFHDDPSHD